MTPIEIARTFGFIAIMSIIITGTILINLTTFIEPGITLIALGISLAVTVLISAIVIKLRSIV